MNRRIIALTMIVTLLLCGCSRSQIETAAPTVLPEDIPELYDAILSDYRTIVDFRLSSNFETAYNNGDDPEISTILTNCIDNGLEYPFGNMLVEMTAGMDDPSEEAFGYVLQDINQDGIPELFWIRKDHFILAVFSIQDNQVKMIDACWSKHKMIVTDEGYLYTQSSGGADYTTFQMLKLESNGALSEIVEFGREGMSCYEITDGKKKRIDETRFQELRSIYPFDEGAYWSSSIIYQISS